MIKPEVKVESSVVLRVLLLFESDGTLWRACFNVNIIVIIIEGKILATNRGIVNGISTFELFDKANWLNSVLKFSNV